MAKGWESFSRIIALAVVLSLMVVSSWDGKLYALGTPPPSPPAPPAGAQTSFKAKTYTNVQYGFSIQYPADWVERPEVAVRSIVAAFGVSGFVPGVSMSVRDADAPLTAEWIARANEAEGNTKNVVSGLTETTLADGTKAMQYKGTFTTPTGYDIMSFAVSVDKGGKRIRATVWTIGAFSPYDEALFSEIAKTLQFGAAPPAPQPPAPTQIYTLSTVVSPVGGGSISPSSGQYNLGTQVTLTATPAAGYNFGNWSGGASGSSPNTTITMNSNKSVTAYFTAITPPPRTPSSASLPISEYVNLAPYNEKIEFQNPRYLSATTGCIHWSAALSLMQGQIINIKLESDSPMFWDSFEKSGAGINIVFALMVSYVEQQGWVTIRSRAKETMQIISTDQDKRIEVTLKVTDTGLYKLLLVNGDLSNSHYCKYDILTSTIPPPSVPISPPKSIPPPAVPTSQPKSLPIDSPTSAVRVTTTAPYLSFQTPKLEPKGIITTVQPTSKAEGLPFQNPSWDPEDLRNKISALAQEYVKKNPYSSKNACKSMSVALWRICKSNNIEADIAAGNLSKWGETRFGCDHVWLIVFDREATPIPVEATTGYVMDVRLEPYKEACVHAFNDGLFSGDWASFYEWRNVYDARFWDCQPYLEAFLFSEPLGFLLSKIFFFIP